MNDTSDEKMNSFLITEGLLEIIFNLISMQLIKVSNEKEANHN